MRLIDADAFKEYITDGFKYIMTEFKTDRVRDLAYQVTYDFCRDIDEAPTVNAIPISVIEDIKAEIDNYISDFIATDIVLQIIDKHIRGDADE